MFQRVGNYCYYFPTYSQGRKAIWNGIGKDGFRYIKHFPKELIDGKPNETEMFIRYKNGSTFQIIGTEDMDKVVGTNPIGCVFSEYSLQNPKAWDFIRPILRENNGWAIFNYTPRGKNHGFDLYEMARMNPKWFVSKLSVDDTHVLTIEDIQEERDSGMSEDMIQQEYYCSFTAAIQGSYYWKEYDQAERENRFTRVPYDPTVPVYTVWDLGIADANAVGFFQAVNRERRMIDYLETTNESLTDIIAKVKNKGYVYGGHFAPHDIEQREYTSGKSRKEFAAGLGIHFEVVPNISIQDGIEAGRRVFKKLIVDKDNCKDWLRAIPQYTKEYDEDKKIFKNSPRHDWTSHPADMYRYFSLVEDRMISQFSMQEEAHVQTVRLNKQSQE